jgi:DNA primase
MTDEQVGELARLAARVQLALDADGAGQEAMLRAARVAAGRRLELRVVPLPSGADPADLVHGEGAGAMQRLVDASVPFVRFRVERALESGDLSSAEGKDLVIAELRPVFEQIPPSALREELLALVAGRVDLSPALVGSWLAQPAPRGGSGGAGPGGSGRGWDAGGRGAAGAGGASGAASSPTGGREAGGSGGPAQLAALDASARAERDFLAQCLALPSDGADALAALDLSAVFTSDLMRRAAAHLREHLASPSSGLADDDHELAKLVAELSVRASQRRGSPSVLKADALMLEILRLRRAIAAARASGLGGVAPLVVELKGREREHDALTERAMAESEQPVR